MYEVQFPETRVPWAKLSDCVGDKLVTVVSESDCVVFVFEKHYARVVLQGWGPEESFLEEKKPNTSSDLFEILKAGLVTPEQCDEYNSNMRKLSEELKEVKDKLLYDKLKKKFEINKD